MLTNDDLQAIKGIVKDEVDPLKKELEEHGKMLQSHGKLLKSHGKMLQSHSKLLQSHGKLLRSLKKDQDIMLTMLDREQVSQKKRIKKIEEHLGFSPTSL